MNWIMHDLFGFGIIGENSQIGGQQSLQTSQYIYCFPFSKRMREIPENVHEI